MVKPQRFLFVLLFAFLLVTSTVFVFLLVSKAEAHRLRSIADGLLGQTEQDVYAQLGEPQERHEYPHKAFPPVGYRPIPPLLNNCVILVYAEGLWIVCIYVSSDGRVIRVHHAAT